MPSPPAEFKDELVIKMMSIDVADPAVLLADIARRRKWCVERLRTRPGERRGDARRPGRRRRFAQNADDVGEYLWRLRSIGLMEATIDWCDAVAGLIELRRPAPVAQRTA